MGSYSDDNYDDSYGYGEDELRPGEEEDQYMNVDIINDCLKPTLTDALRELIFPLIIANAVLKVIHVLINAVSPKEEKSNETNTGCHISTIVIGLILFGFHFRNNVELFALFTTVSTIGVMLVIISSRNYLLKIRNEEENEAESKSDLKSWIGDLKSNPVALIWTFCGILIAINEILTFKFLFLMKLRQHLMLLLMKLVSVADEVSKDAKSKSKKDDDHDVIVQRSYLQVTSYIFHPGSVILGSWHPDFSQDPRIDCKLGSRTKVERPFQAILRKFFKILSKLIFSIVCLILSTCMIQFVTVVFIERHIIFNSYFLLPKFIAVTIHKLVIAYFVALQFRTSHYFICMITSASFIFWNHSSPVTKPLNVEFPRSLVDVVVSWNMPMHTWLKNHVFNPVNSKFKTGGKIIPIMTTYFVSSFLHGFNFQIWSVLITLGGLTYIEFQLRQKLSSVNDICVSTKSCPRSATGSGKCLIGHKNKNLLLAPFLNLLFAISAILHLAYLGSTFDGTEESSYFSNVYQVWFNLGFYSHFILFAQIVFYKLS